MRSLIGAPRFVLLTLSLLACTADDRFVEVDLPQPDPLLRARVDCAWGSFDCNPAVDRVIDRVRALRETGQPMGFHRGVFGDVSRKQHIQGIQRLAGGDAPHLLISRSASCAAEADVGVVALASRAGTGARMGSNRLDPDHEIAATAPPLEDRVVRALDSATGYTHAGGGQVMGQVYAVPLDRDEDGSEIQLLDVSDPLEPTLMGVVPHATPTEGALAAASTAGLVALADGHFLLATSRMAVVTLDFYRSTTTDLRSTDWEFLDTWHELEIETAIDDEHFENYQALQFIAQRDGSIFLVGTHQNWRGQDWLDLFHVDLARRDGRAEIIMTKVGRKHFVCNYHDTVYCDFDAGAGIYLGDDGSLTLYAVEHDNDGPTTTGDPSPGGADGSIKMMEFHDQQAPSGCGLTAGGGFVELYEDDVGGPSLVSEWSDPAAEDFADLDRAEGFDDSVSAMRWCVPDGLRVRLYEERAPCGGRHRDLSGAGTIDLTESEWDDRVSCVQWMAD